MSSSMIKYSDEDQLVKNIEEQLEQQDEGDIDQLMKNVDKKLDETKDDGKTEDDSSKPAEPKEEKTEAPAEKGPDLNTTIDELKNKIDMMTTEVRELKNKQPKIDSDDSDLNDSVMQKGNKKSYSYYLRKQAFLNIMDELDELAEHFASVDYRITKRIDNIADRLRFYDKG